MTVSSLIVQMISQMGVSSESKHGLGSSFCLAFLYWGRGVQRLTPFRVVAT